jgi:hypothetical protein
MTARLAAINHPSATKYANILNAIKPDQVKPEGASAPLRPVTRNTAQGVQNYDFQTGKWTYEVDENGKRVMPWAQPLQPSYTLPSNVVTTEGDVPIFNSKTGRWEVSGLKRPESGDGPSKRDQDLAATDAKFSFTALLDDAGKMKDPPGWKDRLATKFDWSNVAASPSGQTYMKSVRNLIRSWAIIVEGKRMSDADAIANDQLKSFRFGDSAEADAMTKARLESMAQAIKDKIGASGGAARPAEFKMPDGTVWRRP